MRVKTMPKGDFIFDFDKEQLQKLIDATGELSQVDGSQAIMNSLSQGMGIIISKGKSNLASSNNTKSGNLSRSFNRKRVKKWMSVYGGFKKGPGGGNHSHLVDRGTDERWTKKGYTDKLGRTYRAGLYRGSVSKGRPNTGSMFWTKAVKTEAPKAIQKTMDVIYKEVEKIMIKKLK